MYTLVIEVKKTATGYESTATDPNHVEVYAADDSSANAAGASAVAAFRAAHPEPDGPSVTTIVVVAEPEPAPAVPAVEPAP